MRGLLKGKFLREFEPDFFRNCVLSHDTEDVNLLSPVLAVYGVNVSMTVSLVFH